MEPKRFIETILAINPASIDAFGGGVPGMLGSSAATQGAISPAADVVRALKQQAIAFYKAYQETGDCREEASKLEEALLVAEATSVINTAKAERLLDELNQLMTEAEK